MYTILVSEKPGRGEVAPYSCSHEVSVSKVSPCCFIMGPWGPAREVEMHIYTHVCICQMLNWLWKSCGNLITSHRGHLAAVDDLLIHVVTVPCRLECLCLDIA